MLYITIVNGCGGYANVGRSADSFDTRITCVRSVGFKIQDSG